VIVIALKSKNTAPDNLARIPAHNVNGAVVFIVEDCRNSCCFLLKIDVGSSCHLFGWKQKAMRVYRSPSSASSASYAIAQLTTDKTRLTRMGFLSQKVAKGPERS
jgi:hypothetical protein